MSDTPVRLTVHDPVGETVTVAPVPHSPVTQPPPPVEAPVEVPLVVYPSPPPHSPSPPDPTLAALGNPSKIQAVASDSLHFEHIPLSPSMTVPAKAPDPPSFDFDESSLPMPGDFEMPPEWTDPSSHRHEDPWDTGVEDPKTVHLPDPEAQARALQKERDDLLFKLDCLKKQGVDLPKKFNHSSSIDEMRSTYERFHRAQQMESGLQISRKLLIGFTGIIEWANHQYDPLGVKLDGWSTNIMANAEDFDHALLRVWEKYSSAIGEINPLLELVFALAMSGVMYHFMQKRIEEEVKNQEVDREDPTYQAEVQRAAQEMFRAQEAARPRPPSRSATMPPPQASRSPPGPPVFTNPEKARRDKDTAQVRAADAAQARARARESVRTYQARQAAPPAAPAGFNPQGVLGGMLGAGGNEQIQEMMGGMGMGPQGMTMPNFVPPTPTPAPVVEIPAPPPTPHYDADDVVSRPRGRPKKSERVVSIDD